MEDVKFELTQAGLNELEIELDHLDNVARKENIVALQEARAQGDLSENADYDAARDEQARIESRITEIKHILQNYVLIKHTNDDIVNTGKEVKLLFLDDNTEFTFSIVGVLEADPLNNKISHDSPVGNAIYGKKKNDVVNVKTETGREFKVEIVEVN